MIAENNCDGGAVFLKTQYKKTSFYIEIDIPESDENVLAAPEDCRRDIYVYTSPTGDHYLDLNQFEWTSSENYADSE